MGESTLILDKATLVTPDQVDHKTALQISGGRITGTSRLPIAQVVELADHLVYPGLINAHDHLFGTWWPRVAPNRPYRNVYEWLDDYHTSPVLEERSQNPIEDVYALGIYRNLISGVTTVADHFKRLDQPQFFTGRPIDVLYEYGRTWTARKPTEWGDDIPTEYRRAVEKGQPYMIHLAEGADSEVQQELDVLIRHQAVGRNTVVIHGIELRPQDMQLLARVGGSVCWCPTSNLYLYERTANVDALQRAGVNVTLGTDSTLTGSLNLLDEMRTARTTYRKQTGRDIDPRWLIERVTTGAAYALMLDGGRGRLAEGCEADLLVLPERWADPYTNLIEAEPQDIALLLRGGAPLYGDECYRPLFEQFTPDFSRVIVAGKPKLLVGDLSTLLQRISTRIGRQVDLPFLPCTAPQPENVA